MSVLTTPWSRQLPDHDDESHTLFDTLTWRVAWLDIFLYECHFAELLCTVQDLDSKSSIDDDWWLHHTSRYFSAGITVKKVKNCYICKHSVKFILAALRHPRLLLDFLIFRYQLVSKTNNSICSCIVQTDVVRPTWSLMYFSSPFLVIAPSWKLPSTISPSLNTIKHGRPYTLYFSMSSLFPSVQSTFTTFNFPLNSWVTALTLVFHSISWDYNHNNTQTIVHTLSAHSIEGATSLHGPHHVAQKSTKHGSSACIHSLLYLFNSRFSLHVIKPKSYTCTRIIIRTASASIQTTNQPWEPLAQSCSHPPSPLLATLYHVV